MTRIKRDAILTLLIEKLGECGSWCGETHIQKAVYFFEAMLKLNLGFDFIFYKRGPFSFDLQDELTAMRADEFVSLEIKGSGYGPSLVPGRNAGLLKQLFPKTLKRQKHKIGFLAHIFTNKSVIDLEHLAAALYVTHTGDKARSVQERACELTKLKPYVSAEAATCAVKAIDKWYEKAKVDICTLR